MTLQKRAWIDSRSVKTEWYDVAVPVSLTQTREITWADLVQVAIVPVLRDDRFWFEPASYWELQARSRDVIRLTAAEARRGQLVEYLSRLPGFERGIARHAMRSATYTVVWQRRRIRCPRCNVANLVDAEQPPRPWDRYLRCPRCRIRVGYGHQHLRAEMIGGLRSDC